MQSMKTFMAGVDNEPSLALLSVMQMPVTPQQTLQEAIRAAGLTQSEVANRVGVDKAVISRHVHGMPVPQARQEAIAAVLGCAVSDVRWPRPMGAAA
jgi:DNA-binding XRE family transcriptional regulator